MIESRHNYNVYAERFIVVLAWSVVALYAINTLYFTLRVSNPVIQADDWYYLDAFLKKVVDHTLTPFDFFIKRSVDDHAAPLFRLLLLINYRYFDVDYVFDAIAGCLAAIACCLTYRFVIFSEQEPNKNAFKLLCWVAICALQLSLNSIGVWVWPLVSLENLTNFIILLFMLSVWHAHRTQRHFVLAIAVLFLGVTSDDSAVLAVLATMTAFGLMLLVDVTQRHRSAWKIFLIVGICMTSVRIGYAHLPLKYVVDNNHTFLALANAALNRFKDGGWWQWVFLPLVLPVYYQNPFGPANSLAWHTIQGILAILLLAAHLGFWKRAFRIKYNIAAFIAVSLMLLTYGWIAGIVLWRVTWAGNNYLAQPRYILFYVGHMIALLLMWANSPKPSRESGLLRRVLMAWLPVTACLLLLAIQVPQSISAWRMRRYEWEYYIAMTHQIQKLTKEPTTFSSCDELIRPVCEWPAHTREDLTELLRESKLNIFSPKVRQLHQYLPKDENAVK